MEEFMKKIRSVIAAFIASWGMISDYPLPAFVIAPFKMQIPSATVLFCFPFTGALAGAVVWLFAFFCGIVFNQLAGALIFTLLSGFLFFFKDSGRGLSLLISYAAARFSGAAPVTALQNSSSNLNVVLKSPVIILLTGVAVMVILAMFFALFYCGAGIWLAAVIGADAFVQGRLCLEPDRNSKIPFIRTSGDGVKYLAASGILLALIMVAVFPRIAALGAVVILWVWFWRELPGSDEFRNGLSPDWISMCGFWAGILTLLCGMGLL